tara:strand:+ start:37584 stop:37829 length:246 start_codon:yes stop_codon:yes gene_type:complete
MERLFNLYKELIIVHLNYTGVVCGYDDTRFILAVETTDDKNFFRKFRKNDNAFILDKYKDTKYRYIYEDERKIIKELDAKK